MHRALSRAAAAGAVAALVLDPGSASATVVESMTLAEKTAAAPVVIHGVVERVQSDWNLSETRIYTEITVVVLESLKGDFARGERVTVRRGGGTVDGVTMQAPGSSPYAAGEEVVLFLEPLGAVYVTLGIGIGKYAVQPSPSGERFVHHAPEVYGLRYEGTEPVMAPIPPMTPEPLDRFLKRVRTLVARPSAPSTTKRRSPLQLKPPLPLPQR